MVFLIGFGAVLGAGFAALFCRGAGAKRTAAAGLVVAALIYVGFALWGGATSTWLAIEGGGVLVYGAFAWLGIRRSAGWLAAGWALHVVWDVALHQFHDGAAFTPSWYPPLCIGFDLAVAGMVWTPKR